jgi:hypothetical protein
MDADGVIGTSLPEELTDKQQHFIDYLSVYEPLSNIKLEEFELVDLGDTITVKHSQSNSSVLSIGKEDGGLTMHDIAVNNTKLDLDEKGKIKIKGDK